MSTGLCPDPLGELTALPQTPELDHGGREGTGEMEGQGKVRKGKKTGGKEA